MLFNNLIEFINYLNTNPTEIIVDAPIRIECFTFKECGNCWETLLKSSDECEELQI